MGLFRLFELDVFEALVALVFSVSECHGVVEVGDWCLFPVGFGESFGGGRGSFRVCFLRVVVWFCCCV